MARGWESKAIEEQISAAEANRDAQRREILTDFEIEQRKRKEGLLMERARIKRQMEEAHKRRYLVLLERALEHIEEELAKVEKGESS